jgi:hypothetical protein
MIQNVGCDDNLFHFGLENRVSSTKVSISRNTRQGGMYRIYSPFRLSVPYLGLLWTWTLPAD